VLYRCSMRLFRFAFALPLLFLLASCSNSSDAAETIISQQPVVTPTPLTLGGGPTVTPVPDLTLTPTVTATDPTTADGDTGDAGDATPTPVVINTPVSAVDLADTAFTNSSKVTTVGLDEVFFGMQPDAAADAASTSWTGMPETAAWPNCFAIRPSNGPDGVTFFVVNRTIERVNVSHPSIRTPSGLGVGTQLSELQAALGDRLELEDFGDGTQIARFVPADESDAAFRIVFELRDGEVFRYRSGRVGAIEIPYESC